jgi:RNA polymerase sigma-70 factor (ECF subfamily)
VSGPGAVDRELLDAARAGDEDSFRRVVEAYTAELRAHCYRMLGSVHDAEDALQDTLLSAWRGLPRFEGRSSLRSWLYRIATNACLKLIERRPKRVLPVDYGPAADPHDDLAEPLVESVWVEPFPDDRLQGDLAAPDARYEERESVELAFTAALQHLPPRQRAALILRDVLGFSGAEVAEALETTPDSVYSILQRAHKAVDDKLPERSQQATLRALGDESISRLVTDYVDAWERGDVDALAAMLTDDATIAMPPRPSWYRGRAAVAAFLRAWPLAGALEARLVPVRANGQLAFANYTRRGGAGSFTLHAVDVLTLRGSEIEAITAFLTPEALRSFGLPAEIS